MLPYPGAHPLSIDPMFMYMKESAILVSDPIKKIIVRDVHQDRRSMTLLQRLSLNLDIYRGPRRT